MVNKKLTRQDVFNKVWTHYIVEGKPYAATPSSKEVKVSPAIQTTDGEKSPIGLLMPEINSGIYIGLDLKGVYKIISAQFNTHVDYAFVKKLQDSHDATVKFIYEGIDLLSVKNIYARRFRRLFRKTLKYYLIAFAFNYGLTIPSEIPHTVHARKAAKHNKD